MVELGFGESLRALDEDRLDDLKFLLVEIHPIGQPEAFVLGREIKLVCKKALIKHDQREQEPAKDSTTTSSASLIKRRITFGFCAGKSLPKMSRPVDLVCEKQNAWSLSDQ